MIEEKFKDIENLTPITSDKINMIIDNSYKRIVKKANEI